MHGVCARALSVCGSKWVHSAARSVHGALNRPQCYPWIVQLMPGDDGADRHTEAPTAYCASQ